MVRLVLLSALLLILNACADAGLQRTTASQRLTFSQVSLDPESAKTMINGYRSKRGLKPLTMNDKLTQAAKRHSADLARHDRITHRGSDGTDPWDRVRKTGYKARLAAGPTCRCRRRPTPKSWHHSHQLLFSSKRFSQIADTFFL